MTKVEEVVPSLEFPFLKLNDVQVVFAGISNFTEVVEACPISFFSDSNDKEWVRAALELQSNGWTNERMVWACEHFRIQDSEIAKAQIGYINAWLTSFRPRQEVKQAVCGWLLSLTFNECPRWS